MHNFLLYFFLWSLLNSTVSYRLTSEKGVEAAAIDNYNRDLSDAFPSLVLHSQVNKVKVTNQQKLGKDGQTEHRTKNNSSQNKTVEEKVLLPSLSVILDCIKKIVENVSKVLPCNQGINSSRIINESAKGKHKEETIALYGFVIDLKWPEQESSKIEIFARYADNVIPPLNYSKQQRDYVYQPTNEENADSSSRFNALKNVVRGIILAKQKEKEEQNIVSNQEYIPLSSKNVTMNRTVTNTSYTDSNSTDGKHTLKNLWGKVKNFLRGYM